MWCVIPSDYCSFDLLGDKAVDAAGAGLCVCVCERETCGPLSFSAHCWRKPGNLQLPFPCVRISFLPLSEDPEVSSQMLCSQTPGSEFTGMPDRRVIASCYLDWLVTGQLILQRQLHMGELISVRGWGGDTQGSFLGPADTRWACFVFKPTGQADHKAGVGRQLCPG